MITVTTRIGLSVLIAIVVSGAVLRLYHIDNQSFWWDEALAMVVAQASARDTINHLKFDAETPRPSFGWPARAAPVWEANPPLYFMALHGWLALFGAQPVQARMMSAAAGVLALIMIFAVGGELFDQPTALIATLLLAVSQIGVAFSQEARSYELLLLLFLTTWYLFVIAQSRRSSLAWCGFVVTAVLMVGTHYYGAFALLAMILYLAARWRSAPISWGWIAGAAATWTATLLPWMIFVFVSGRSVGAPDRRSVVHWTTAVSTLNKFNNGAIAGLLNTMPRWTFLVGTLLFTVPALMAIVGWLKDRDGAGSARANGTLMCLLTGLVPVSCVIALTIVAGAPFDIRYVSFCIAPYYLLAAAGIRRVRSLALRAVVIAAIVAYSGLALSANYHIPYKEDYRGAAAYVMNRALERDCYTFVPFGAPPVGWMIYMPGPPGATLISPEQVERSDECQRIWVVTFERGYGPEEGSIPDSWQAWRRGFTASHRQIDLQQFFLIRVELYTPGPVRSGIARE